MTDDEVGRVIEAVEQTGELDNTLIFLIYGDNGTSGGRFGGWALYVNGKKVAEGRIERTQPMIFSADETADVGIDLATPVVESIGSEAESRFTGMISRVTVEVK